jgi:hypothetical protein
MERWERRRRRRRRRRRGGEGARENSWEKTLPHLQHPKHGGEVFEAAVSDLHSEHLGGNTQRTPHQSINQ